MAMIAYALRETRENDNVAYRDQLSEITTTQERDALIFQMVDGTQFKIVVEAI